MQGQPSSITGALQEAELRATVVAAGVVEFEIVSRVDVYADAPQARHFH